MKLLSNYFRHILNIFFAVTINQPARVLGIMLSSFLADRFGRKPCLIVGAVSQIVSSASIYFCTTYISLMVALSLNGLCVITVMVPSYSLLSEICLIRYKVTIFIRFDHLYLISDTEALLPV